LETRFTWDPEKAKANARKHGISFEMAEEVFEDSHHLVFQNAFIDNEQREQAVGMTRGLLVVAVVFVDRSEPGAEIVRIISARKADRYEQNLYQDQRFA
jgi:uncharacterized protein